MSRLGLRPGDLDMRSSCLSVSAMGMPMRSRSVVKVVLLLTMGASPAAALLTQMPQPRALPHAGITRPHTPVLSSLRPQLQLPNARASTLRMSSKPEPTVPGESFQLYPYRWVQLGYLSVLALLSDCAQHEDRTHRRDRAGKKCFRRL